MFGVITFMPTYFQGVVGMTATYSGAVLIPLTATMVIGSVSSGMLMKRAGYKIFIVSGALFVALGMLWLSQLGTDPPVWLAVVGMMICGLGMGFGMQTLIVAIQNVIVRHLVGTGTSTMVLIRSLGSTIGVTVLGTILNRRFEHEFDSQVPKPVQAQILANPVIDGHKDRIPQLLSSDLFLKNTPPAVIDGIKVAFSNSISMLFLISFVLALIAFIVALFLKSVPLKSMEEYNANTHENREKARKAKESEGNKKAKGKE
jgi:MFS family permease